MGKTFFAREPSGPPSTLWAADSAGARRPGKQEDEEFDDDELDQVMALKPSLLEQFTRHLIWRHLHPEIYREPDVMSIDGHYADAVYAPLIETIARHNGPKGVLLPPSRARPISVCVTRLPLSAQWTYNLDLWSYFSASE